MQGKRRSDEAFINLDLRLKDTGDQISISSAVKFEPVM